MLVNRFKNKEMKIKQIIIYEVDLKKLAEKKGFNMSNLAKKAGVNYEHLLRCASGIITMSDEHWKKIKKVL